ncbi:MAG: COG2426 family protein [Christensenellales bacterium]
MQDILITIFKDNNFLATIFASMLPVIEARGAVPFALSNDLWTTPLGPFLTFLACIFGSSIMVIILLAITYPLCNALKKIKFVKSFIDKLNTKVQKIKEKNSVDTKSEFKKYLFLLFFTALPIPLTGYYTASLIASFCNFNKYKSFTAITCGNLICISFMLIVSLIAKEYVTLLFYFFLIAFIIVIAYFIFDTILQKRKTKKDNANLLSEIDSNTK